ncbi:MAG: PQQ-binding-like beta-propeller repeat protein [Acidobacteria bacterium]|nr:PQQ-binding-like beta-propeller repeat protein [Acidobacteriota bacterium]
MRQPLIVLPILAAGLVLAVLPVSGSEGDPDTAWPAWRGPRATGEAPVANPPLNWSEKKNVRWKVAIPGKGLSTPVIWGDKIFLTTAIPAGLRPDPETAARAEADLPEWRRDRGVAPDHVQKFTVLALDRASGAILWQRVLREEAPHEGTHADASWASASAVTDGDTLIVSFGSYGIYALDLDGALLWQKDLGDMKTRRGFGEGGTPALAGNTVVINWDHEGPSFITALDRRTGDLLWRRERDEVTSWSSPVVVQAGERSQVVINATSRTRGYDLATGDVVWEIEGMTVNTIPSPVAAGGRLFVASGFRGAMLQAIDLQKAHGPLDGPPGVTWTYPQDTPYVPSLLLAQGRLYFLKGNTGILTCLDAASGRELFSRQRLPEIDSVYASPVAAGGRVYVTGRHGTTVVLEAGDTYEVLAVNHLDDGFDASAALVGDELYLRGRKYLYCLAAGTSD